MEDSTFIDSMLKLYQATATIDHGPDVIVVLNQGTAGEYTHNPTINAYEAKGYRLVDSHYAGSPSRLYEFLTFKPIKD